MQNLLDEIKMRNGKGWDVKRREINYCNLLKGSSSKGEIERKINFLFLPEIERKIKFMLLPEIETTSNFVRSR